MAPLIVLPITTPGISSISKHLFLIASVGAPSCSRLKWSSSMRFSTNVEHSTTQAPKSSISNAAREIMFVPESSPVSKTALKQLQDFVSASEKLFVLTGAGISTESGIPDYRSQGVGLYARSDSRPILYQDFVKSASRRRRYWARNFVGWPRFSSVQPNICHWVLADWERAGKIHWLVTQNVDSLHTKAQSKRVTELHGCSARIICLHCGQKSTREELQQRMREMNPNFNIDSQAIAPDGDVILSDDVVSQFGVPPCRNCNGVLQPDLVFFGGNVPRSVKDSVHARLQEADAMLVAGSSLEVYSGYRFALAAKDHQKPIAIVNIGPTRADGLATLKIDARLSDVLPFIHVA